MSETNAISGTGHVRSGGLLGGREASDQQDDVISAGPPLAGRSLPPEFCACGWHMWLCRPLSKACRKNKAGGERSDPANTEAEK
jgi:hypothetical protein